MKTLPLLLTACALLLAAAGLLLWQRAQLKTRQQQSARFIETQLRALPLPSPMPAATLPGDTEGPWRPLFLRAGLRPTPRVWFRLLAPGVLFILSALLFGGLLSGGAAALLYALLLAFLVWRRMARRRQRMAQQLPHFLDAMVRLMSIGNSLGSAFQTAVPTTDAPLREVLERAGGLLQAGMNLDAALHQQARLYRFAGLELVAAVIAVAGRIGGRADMVLERMGLFMRDLEQAQQELVALSAETRLSAWVMGLLPIALGLFIIVFNNRMFTGMLADPVGRGMLIAAAALEVLGVLWMVKLARSV